MSVPLVYNSPTVSLYSFGTTVEGWFFVHESGKINFGRETYVIHDLFIVILYTHRKDETSILYLLTQIPGETGVHRKDVYA